MIAPASGSPRGMRRLHWFMAGALCGAGAASVLVYQSLSYHFLRTDVGLVKLPKASATLSETFLDVRDYGPIEWGRHKQVVLAAMRADRLDVLKSESPDARQARLSALLSDLQSAEMPAGFPGPANSARPLDADAETIRDEGEATDEEELTADEDAASNAPFKRRASRPARDR